MTALKIQLGWLKVRCGRKLCVLSVLAALCAVLLPAAAPAQTKVSLAFPDDTRFVQSSLREHLPRATTGYRLADGMTGHVLAVTTAGVAWKKFNTPTRSWGPWYHTGNPTGIPTSDWDLSMPILRTPLGTANAIDGFFGYVSGSSGRIGNPGAVDSPIAMDFGTLPVDTSVAPYFHAETAITYAEGSGASAIQKIRVFGNAAEDGDPKDLDLLPGLDFSLLEYHHNGSSWSLHNRGKPAGSRSVNLGPQSACAIHLNTSSQVRHLVFARAEHADTDKVAYCYWNGQSWSWKDLGAPFAYTDIVSAPLVVHRYDNPALPPQINVFIVARQRSSGRFTLYQNYWNGTLQGDPAARTETLNWSGWLNFGHPIDPAGQPLLEAGKKFLMTTGCLWRQGSTLRVDLFGYVGGYTDPATGASAPGKLLRFYWNGGWWYWDTAVGSPDGEGIRTEGSFVVDGSDYDRVSVIGRSSAGRIYERYYENQNGVPTIWKWTNLSTVEFSFLP